jgi:molecular chaperone DnaJ
MSARVAEKRDYYEVLGVDRNATADEIKRAYRQAAMKYHPDRNKEQGAEARFKEAAEAYEILSDQEKRARYDRYGHAGLNGARTRDYAHMNPDDIFSVFADLFGGDSPFGGRGRASRTHGVDIETTLEIDLKDVATGVERKLRFHRMDLCETCDGSGAAPGSRKRQCSTCGGYGQVERQANVGFFVTRTVTECPTCAGRGYHIEQKCSLCGGVGRREAERTIDVKIPAGIHDGQSIRVRGEGEPGPHGNARGDLLCSIRVREHDFLQRDGDHLICRVPISFTQAALGAQLEVPTLHGGAPLKVPPGTQHGAVFKLAGKGLPNLRSGRVGDQIVQVLVEIPRKLTKTQQDLLRKFAETEDANVLPETKGFFDRLKDYLLGDDDAPTKK